MTCLHGIKDSSTSTDVGPNLCIVLVYQWTLAYICQFSSHLFKDMSYSFSSYPPQIFAQPPHSASLIDSPSPPPNRGPQPGRSLTFYSDPSLHPSDGTISSPYPSFAYPSLNAPANPGAQPASSTVYPQPIDGVFEPDASAYLQTAPVHTPRCNMLSIPHATSPPISVQNFQSQYSFANFSTASEVSPFLKSWVHQPPNPEELSVDGEPPSHSRGTVSYQAEEYNAGSGTSMVSDGKFWTRVEVSELLLIEPLCMARGRTNVSS